MNTSNNVKKARCFYVPQDLQSNKGTLGELLSVFQPGVAQFEWVVMPFFSLLSSIFRPRSVFVQTRFGIINNWNTRRSENFYWLISTVGRVKWLWPSGSVFDKHKIRRQEGGSEACLYMENQPLLLMKTWDCSSKWPPIYAMYSLF